MPEVKRQLAIIMFTNIFGYTGLIGKDSGEGLKPVKNAKFNVFFSNET